MKQILSSYLFVLLILVAVVSILSYGYGSGYVYIYFRHWQIQSNFWALLIFLVLLSLIGQVLWLLLKRYFGRLEQRKQKVFNFEHLHPGSVPMTFASARRPSCNATTICSA